MKINNFQPKVVDKVLKQVTEECSRTPENHEEPPRDEEDNTVIVQLTLPYAGRKGEIISKEINKHSKQVKKCHQHDLVYETKCPDCNVTYIGEIVRRLEVRAKDHGRSDKKSEMAKHTRISGHRLVTLNDF